LSRIWGLRPERKTELMGFVAGHREYEQRLEEIEAHLARGELTAARGIFDHLAQAFEKHEAAEERVLSALDRELEATA
jgi:hypothetical protein